MALDPGSLKALIVDDHISARLSLVSLLNKIGFTQVDEACSAQQAKDVMDSNTYDIIFLDWNLPDGTGLSILQRCRQDAAYDNCAFVIVSAETTDHYIIEALKAGATSYIVKPLVTDSFGQHINKVFSWLTKKRAALAEAQAKTA